MPHTYHQLALSWGVTPLLADVKQSTDDLFAHAVERAQAAGFVRDGDIVVITAGVPLGINGTTNLLKVHVVGDILVSGQGVNGRCAFGRLCVARTGEEALASFNDGDILVVPQTSNELLPIMKKASGIVTERGGLNSVSYTHLDVYKRQAYSVWQRLATMGFCGCSDFNSGVKIKSISQKEGATAEKLVYNKNTDESDQQGSF